MSLGGADRDSCDRPEHDEKDRNFVRIHRKEMTGRICDDRMTNDRDERQMTEHGSHNRFSRVAPKFFPSLRFS